MLFVEELNEERFGETKQFRSTGLEHQKIFLALSIGRILLEVLDAISQFRESRLHDILKHFSSIDLTRIVKAKPLVV